MVEAVAVVFTGWVSGTGGRGFEELPAEDRGEVLDDVAIESIPAPGSLPDSAGAEPVGNGAC